MKLEDDPSIKVFKRRIGESFGCYFVGIRDFWNEVLSKHFSTFSEAVEFQGNAVNKKDKFFILDLALDWVEGHRQWRFRTKTSKLSHIKGPFMHNRASLPQDRSFHFSSDVPPVEGNLNLDSFKHIVLNSNQTYRPIFLMMAQGLMGEKEAIYVSNNLWREVLDAITKRAGIIRLTLPGRKQNRNKENFFTMLDCGKSDFASAMQAYLKSLDQVPKDCLFRNVQGNPITEYNIQFYFHCRAVETSVIQQITPECSRCNGETVRIRKSHPKLKGKDGKPLRKIAYKCKECASIVWAKDSNFNYRTNRYGVNPHEIRDLMSSRWPQSGADRAVREYIMGHPRRVDPNLYEKIKYQQGFAETEYRKALPWLNVLSCDPLKVDRTEIDSKLEARDAEVEVLRREVAKFKKLERHLPLLLKVAKKYEKELEKE